MLICNKVLVGLLVSDCPKDAKSCNDASFGNYKISIKV